MPASNSRGGHSRSRDVNSDDDISDDDISDNHDGIGDSEYDDEDVDDSLSTKSSRIHHNRGHHQSNRRPARDSSRPRSTVRYFVFDGFWYAIPWFKRSNRSWNVKILLYIDILVIPYKHVSNQTRIMWKKLANWNLQSTSPLKGYTSKMNFR